MQDWFPRGREGKLPRDRVLEAPCELIDQIIDCCSPHNAPLVRQRDSMRIDNEIQPSFFFFYTVAVTCFISLLAQSAKRWRHNRVFCVYVITMGQLKRLWIIRIVTRARIHVLVCNEKKYPLTSPCFFGNKRHWNIPPPSKCHQMFLWTFVVSLLVVAIV